MGFGARAGTFALLALILAPAGMADHCASGITVFGRSAMAPGIVPPASPLPGYCSPLEPALEPAHVLPPLSDQIFVRMEIDVGATYRELRLRLEGLGFGGQQHYQLHRVRSPLGSWSYELDEWLSIPDAPGASGELRATVKYPAGYELSVTYTLAPLPSTPTELGLP